MSTEKKNGYTAYTGGNKELDQAIEQYSQAYAQAREKALAGDKSAVSAMQEANDRANQLRNQYGYAAQLADKDIAYVRSQAEAAETAKAAGAVKTASAGKAASTAPAAGVTADRTAAVKKVTYTPARVEIPDIPVNDYSDYLTAMNKAHREAAAAELKAAYDKNLARLDLAGEQIAPAYEAARNRAAGQAARSGQQFNEFAAAHGLGSGANAQAQLAMGNQLQGTLGDLSAREADALAQLDLEKADLDTDYNAAIAKAKSEGDYQLAQQLYNEKVRRDEALTAIAKWRVQQDQWQAEWQSRQEQWAAELQAKLDQWEDQRDYQDRSFQWQQDRADREEALAAAKLDFETEKDLQDMLLQYAAATGDYSSMAAYYTPEQIANLRAQWQAKEDAAAQAKREAAEKSDRELADWAAKYGDYAGLRALGLDTSALQKALDEKQQAKAAESAKTAVYKPKLTVTQVDKAIDNGRITDQVKRDFAYYYGVSYDAFFDIGEDNLKPLNEAQFISAMDTLSSLMEEKDYAQAAKEISALETRLDVRQKDEMDKLIKKYGSGTR